MIGRSGGWVAAWVAGCALLAGCVPASNPVEFSPAGDRLVFPWGPKETLYEVRADGTGLRPLPGTEGSSGPRWSPRGDTIAFAQEGDLVLYDVNHDRVEHRLAGGVNPAVWAPDGSRLGVFRHAEDRFVATWYQLPDLRASTDVALPVQHVSAAQAPRWLESRDGMAFLASEAEVFNIYTVEGDSVYRITNTGDVLGFGLASDGEHLLWARSNPQVREGGITLWSYDLQRRSVRKLPFAARFTEEKGRPSGGGPVVAEVQFALAAISWPCSWSSPGVPSRCGRAGWTALRPGGSSEHR